MTLIKADKVLVNGKIHNFSGSSITALAIYDSRIALLGSDNEILESAGPNTEVINLSGRLVTPGFIDTHVHPAMAGATMTGDIDFKTLQPKSILEFQEIVRKKVSETQKGCWIKGWGYDEERFTEARLPNRWEIDTIAPNNPVFLIQTCGHVATANSRALEIGKVSKDMDDPKQGIIDRNHNGEPTGVLRNRAQRLIKKHLPRNGHRRMKEDLRMALERLASYGVTSIHDAWAGPSLITLYQELLSEGRLPLRVGLIPPIANQFEGDYLSQLTSLGLKTGFGSHMIRFVGAKVALDGMLRSGTAALRENYVGKKGDMGLLTIDKDVLQDKVQTCHAAGIRVCIHAEGDRGIDTALDVIEMAKAENPEVNLRHRIEHFGLCYAEQINRMNKLGVIPSVSINFIRDIGEGYEKVLGPKRIEWVYPLKTLEDYGIIGSCNSDWPVSVGNPMIGIHSAVARKTWKENDLGVSQKVTVDEAVKAYTWNGAYASNEEEIKGSIEVGKFADLAVIDRDIFTVPVDIILEAKVDMTLLGGQIVYQRAI
ncbi:MAG: amidohydrolase [Candidatus Bathyarchaeota archaeon]|nr:amidohydrolase [Candidatus Bathyarchaeota archaeon]MDP7443333.1 amidohydrolase [Candidatus Bathyarchaeota archaeon]